MEARFRSRRPSAGRGVTARYPPGQHGSSLTAPLPIVTVRVTARYPPGQHGSTTSCPSCGELTLVTARYPPGQHGSDNTAHKARAEATSRPGIRRASMEAAMHSSMSCRAIWSHGPVSAGPAWKLHRLRCAQAPLRVVTARYPPGQHGSRGTCYLGALDLGVTARYPPGQHGSDACFFTQSGWRYVTARYPPGQHGSPVFTPTASTVFRSRPGIRRASMEARTRRRMPWMTNSSHGPVSAGPAWKPSLDDGGVLRPFPVTARYPPGQHGSIGSPRPLSAWGSSHGPVSAGPAWKRALLPEEDVALRGRHGPASAGPAWKPPLRVDEAAG